MKEENSESQSAQSVRLSTRMQREIKLLHSDPPPGVCAWPANQNLLNHLEAQIEGPEGTVYAKGVFKLEIQVPERYPFEPPNVRFVTPIYHPNIDSGGRICLDILNLPPKGAWRPSLNIATVLASIGLLLSEPNPDDGLMCDISAEYKHNRSTFDQKARSWTQKYAVQMECQITTLPTNISSPGSSPLGSNERIDNPKQFEEAAVESVSGSPNQSNIKGKPKDRGPGCPVKSTKSLSKRLSLAKEPMLQPTISTASAETVTDVGAKMYKENASFRPAQCDGKNLQQKLPTHPSVETNDNKDELLQKVQIGDSSSLLENLSTEPGKNVQKGVILGKENFHLRNWNAEKPHCKLSVSKPLECETEIKTRENTKLRPLHNGLSGNSNQRILPFASDNDPQCSKLHELQPTRPINHNLPVSGLLRPEGVHKKITEEMTQVETVVISDSESDEKPVQVRSRLSLSQRTLTGKRKFRSNAR
ncbi:hypothetical protein SUGI_0584750 [Cryptomeria japonica]|uniref:probable ubiquitin-conjugating enzyme E2 37 n=1 Tax=Cryptomeria japonica TaxID=3369 RepID=UPI002414BC38|nr:probable ubiquitin-conjugating enzyme E2 37 [Cryptomeria japonica]GLJ29654.1 hypothetical protein SUGI_0584750 [Cryptomeria japonica]